MDGYAAVNSTHFDGQGTTDEEQDEEGDCAAALGLQHQSRGQARMRNDDDRCRRTAPMQHGHDHVQLIWR